MMKSRLKSLVSAGESASQGPVRDHSMNRDQELLARFQEHPRQELGTSQFFNKFQSGFSSSLLQVLNTSTGSIRRDQKDADFGPILGNQQLPSEQYYSELKRLLADRDDLTSKAGTESDCYLGALGPLSRSTQVDPNPFLGALGPLRNSHRNDSTLFNDCQNANFSPSTSSSFFFEAL